VIDYEGIAGYLPPSQADAAIDAEPHLRVAVYHHYDERDVLLYVGIAAWVPTRDLWHSMQAQWVKYAARMDGVWYDNRKIALEAERREIESKLPIFNDQYIRAGRKERIAAYLAERGEPPQRPPAPDPTPVGTGSWWERELEIRAICEKLRDGTATRLRTAAGMTKTEMARRLGVCESTIGRWEEGKRRPKDHHVFKLDRLLSELEATYGSAEIDTPSAAA
jgi:DNA-binding XRE family transcriptional regulator